MALLRFIFMVPVYIIKFIFKIFGWIVVAFLFLLRPFIGKVSWQQPSWIKFVSNSLNKLGNFLLKRIKVVCITLFVLAVAAAGGYYAYILEQNKPKPIEIAPIVFTNYKATVYAPAKTDYANENIIYNNLYIVFDGSVAPLENINKNITAGITMTPSQKGVWKWLDEERLVFLPDEDWKVEQTYNIKIDPKIVLKKEALLDKDEYKFKTSSFNYSIVNSELYQNPEKPEEKNVIFLVNFTHPVDVVEFEKQISIKFIAPEKYKIKDKDFSFVVKYDEKKLNAWIRTEFVKLPEVDSQMTLFINKGVKSSLGGEKTTVNTRMGQLVTTMNVNVISNTFLSLVESENNKQEQILLVNLIDDVNIKDVSKEVKAWILPKDKPATVLTPGVKNHYWNSNDDISPIVLEKSKPLNLVLDNADSDKGNSLVFKYKANPNEYIFVTIGKNIQTEGGYKAKEVKNVVLHVPEYPKYLQFLGKGSLLSLKGEKKIPIVSRNLNGVQLDIKRVIPSQIQHLVSFNYNWEFTNMSFDYYDENSFVERFTFNKTLPNNNPGALTYDGIDMSDYLKHDRKGIFLVNLLSWDPKTKGTYSYANRLIVLTDIGMVAKYSADYSHDLFVQSISTGKPIANVNVSVLGKNGIALFSAQSDINGHVKFGNLDNLKNEKVPVVFIAQKGEDLSFLPYAYYAKDRYLDFSRFDTGGMYYINEAGALSAHLFSDRGLYRPGDTINIGAITRAQNWDISVEGIPVEAKIYDPRGQHVKTIPFKLDSTGFNELTFETDESSPTGNWIVSLDIASGYKKIGGTTIGTAFVNVREFEPDRMKVELLLEPKNIKGWVKPQELEVTLKVENLFGTPAQNRRVSSNLILNPTSLSFSGFSDYTFYDGYNSKGRFSLPLEDTTTDLNGLAKLSLLLQEHEAASYQLTIISEAFEAGAGRGVSATKSLIVTPNDYLVGAKADGNIGYIKKDTSRNLNIIAINQDLEKVEKSNLTIEIVEQKYISVLTMQNSGVYKYQSKLKELLISSNKLDISKNGTLHEIDTKTPGTYLIFVKNEKGDVLYKTAYRIVGSSNIDRSLERTAELDMKLNFGEYNNGDEIEISIDSPYTGSGIITIEKDKVYSWKWFNTNTTSSVQTIKVPAELKGNGYVNVQFIRDPNSIEIFMSPLSFGVAPFKVKNTKESASIELKAPKLIKPGNDIKITVKTSEKQKVIVFAVDEGILQVANYKLVNPLSFFFKKQRLSVRSYQILDLILPEYSKIIALTSAAGGDSEITDSTDVEANKHLNPFKRKVDKPVVFWSGIEEINGEKTFTYNVPDYFNGKLRVMAVAVSNKKIGIDQTSTTVRDDFVLTPNVPFVAAPKDEFEVTLGVSNNLENLNGKAVPIEVSLVSTQHIKIVGNITQTIMLGEKQEGMVKFNVIATNELGGAELIFRAIYEDKIEKKTYTTQRVATTSIRPVTQFRTQTVMGRMGKDKESVENNRDMYSEYSKRVAKSSHSPLVLSAGLASYLDNYPHQCSEQLVSKAIPFLIQDKYKGLIAPSNAKMSYDTLALVLKSRQNSKGAIGLWQTTANGDIFVTLYTANFLIEARENGVTVSTSLLKDLNVYLTNFASDNNVIDEEGLKLRAYAVYLLTRQGVVTTNMLSSIQKSLEFHFKDTWRNNVHALYIASTYKMLKMDKEADELLQGAWKQLNSAYSNAWWSRNYFDPLVVNANAIYLISKHFPEKVKDIPAQALENMTMMIRSNKYTTVSSAMSILAIDSYSKALQKLAQENPKDKLSIEAQSKKDGALSRLISTTDELMAKADFNNDDSKITFINPAKLPTWYSVVQEGYDVNPPKEAVKKGLEVYREYTDESGNPITKVTLGKKINVTIKVRANSKEGVSNVAIIDLLPGGFEVVQQEVLAKVANEEDNYEYEGYASSVRLGGSSWNVDYTDVREDRVLIYGFANNNLLEFKYQIKATNVGTYQIPPVYAEAMYDRDVQALSFANERMIVEPAK